MRNNAAFKRFWPLILMAVLWLIILIVPAMNLLFRVQLGGSATTQFSATPSPADIPNFWEKAARRFPDDVNVLWQAAEEYPVSEEPEEDAEYSEEPEDDGIAPPMLAPEPAVAPTPGSSLLPKSQAFPGQLEGAPAKEKLRRLDLLIARFPNNADLIAARLIATLARMGNGRVGGEMSDAKLQENQAAGKPSPERSKDKPNYTAAELKKAIAIARRGGALESDNGFFDWMECCFLIYAWRDGEAFQALDAAARKKRFDDHALAAQNARLAALATVFNRPLLFEEKLQDYYNSFEFSVSGRYREMARILAWQSVKAQRRGDHKKALRITVGLARTAARMRENSETYIEGLVAAAMEAIAWSSPTFDARAARRGTRRSSSQQPINSFQTYARKYGRPELAAEAGRNAEASAKFRSTVSARINSGSAYGLSFWAFILSTLLWTAGVLLLLLLALPFFLLAIFWVLNRIPRVRGVLRLDESNVEEIPHRREVLGGALACGGVRALGTAICGALVVGLAYLSLLIGVGQTAEITKFIGDFQSNFIGGVNNFGPMEGIYYLLSETGAPQSHWRWMVALSPFLFGILFAAWRATEFQKRQNGEVPFSTRAFFQSLLQGHTFRSPSGARDDLDVTAAFLKLSDWFLMLMLIGSWIWLGSVESNDTYFAWLIPLTLTCFFSSVLLWEKIALWRARSHRLQALRYGLRLWKRSLWAWLVLGSALYFASLLVSLPVRQNIERRVDRVLRLGEVGATLPDER